MEEEAKEVAVAEVKAAAAAAAAAAGKGKQVWNNPRTSLARSCMSLRKMRPNLHGILSSVDHH